LADRSRSNDPLSWTAGDAIKFFNVWIESTEEPKETTTIYLVVPPIVLDELSESVTDPINRQRLGLANLALLMLNSESRDGAWLELMIIDTLITCVWQHGIVPLGNAFPIFKASPSFSPHFC